MKPIIWTFLLLISSVAYGKSFKVGKNLEFSSIKEALKFTKDSDTLYIYSGHYKEGNIVVSTAIKIIGIDYPVLDGEFKTEVLSIKANNVLVQGLKVINSAVSSMEEPCGIKLYDCNNVEVVDNILEQNFFGIYLQYCNNCLVKDNRIRSTGVSEQNTGNGIHCWKSSELKVIHNTVTGHRDGIYFEFVKHSVIWRNYSHNNIRYGLHFMFSNDDSYITNRFENNGAGVAVMYTKNVKMFNNTFKDNWGDSSYGLLLKDISDTYIFNNEFSNNTMAILMEGGSRIDLLRNRFYGNGWGLKITANCMDVNATHNEFKGNTFDVSTNGTLFLNNFDNNFWDKYEGYDLNRNGIGDVPYHPLSLFSVIVVQMPSAMLLFRSFIITLLDKSEKIFPSLTPEDFLDNSPLMKPYST